LRGRSLHLIAARIKTRPMSDRDAGARIAQTLAHSWRPTVPPLPQPARLIQGCEDRLLAAGCGALVWRRVEQRAWRTSASGSAFGQASRIHALQARLNAEHVAVAVRTLRAAGVEPIVAKGWSIASRYPAAGLRPHGDVDLCVPDECYARSMDAIARAAAPRQHERRLTSFRADVHAAFTDIADRSYAELLDRSQVRALDDGDVRVLADEDQLRLICLHFLRHGAWRPLWLCDIALFAESLPERFDWDTCLRGRRRDAEQIACAIGLAHALLGATLPDFPLVRRAARLPRWLAGAVLAQWSKPHFRYPVISAARPVRRRDIVVSAIRSRWPNPIEASVRTAGPFNSAPRFPFQLADSMRRAGLLIARFASR
jgi:hypothetical protein